MQGSRCTSCEHGHIMAGHRETEAIAYCTYVFSQVILVPFKVRDCSSYEDKGQPSWEQMKELALPIRETTTSKRTGFTFPEVEEGEVVAKAVYPSSR